jgi:hypothetical protein
MKRIIQVEGKSFFAIMNNKFFRIKEFHSSHLKTKEIQEQTSDYESAHFACK